MSIRKRLFALTLALSVVVGLTTAARAQVVPPLPTPPLMPISVQAVVRPGHVVDVTFQLAPTGPPAGVVQVEIWSTAGWKSKVAYVNPDAPPVPFHVPTGQFAALVTAINSVGKSPPQLSNFVTVTAGCSTADVCVNVDELPGATPNSLAAAGFLQSTRTNDVPPIKADAALTSALHPKHWRVSGASMAIDVKPYGAVPTMMMSGQWEAEHNGQWLNPGGDLSGIRAWAAQTVRNAQMWGAGIQYWDLWNEPDNFVCASGCEPANVLQLMLRVYQGIKDADPNAKIVGPSVAQFVDSYTAPANRLNARTFVAFAAANGMQLDALSWHVNNEAPELQDTTPLPAVIADHVQRAHALLAQYPQVGQPALFINEFGKESSHMLPGWITGYMAQFDKLPVDQANRTCYAAECAEPGLNGLLTKTGATWTGTTAAYWTYEAYARMDGGTRLATNSSTIWRFDGTATRHDAASTVRALLGAHWNCNRASGNTWCPNTIDVGLLTASINIAWPYSGTEVNVLVRRLPAGIAPIAQPAGTTTVATVSNGRVVVPLTLIADGDAVAIEVTPRS